MQISFKSGCPCSLYLISLIIQDNQHYIIKEQFILVYSTVTSQPSRQQLMTHNPCRFEFYTQLPDGSGFTIKGSTHVFKYDKRGGWFDEQGNYYNSKGQPAFEDDPSSESKSSSHDDPDYDDGYDDFYDEIEKQYGGYANSGEDDNEQYNDEEIRDLQKIEQNCEKLAGYPVNQPLRVYYRNLDKNLNNTEILNLFKKYAQVLAVVPTLDKQSRQIGEGQLIFGTKEQAKRVVELQGKTLGNRSVYFRCEKLEELSLKPIPESVLGQNKNTVLQEATTQINSKSCDKQPTVNGTTGHPKEGQPPKPVVAQAKLPKTFNLYSFDINLFKNSEQFKTWMKSSSGFVFQVDYKNLKKRTLSTGAVGLVELISSLSLSSLCSRFQGKDVKWKLQPQ